MTGERDGAWRVELLGAVRARRGSRVIERFETQKTAALLAWLALHGTSAHSREALIERFWPDREPRVGRASLRQALSSLRGAFERRGGGRVIVAGRFEARIVLGAMTTDAAEFEAALAAAARRRFPSSTTGRTATALRATATSQASGRLPGPAPSRSTSRHPLRGWPRTRIG